MKSFGTLKHFIFAFVIALAVYAVFYKGIEHLRTRHGVRAGRSDAYVELRSTISASSAA